MNETHGIQQKQPTEAKDQLAMPQEDDPAGDGHMWSGKGMVAEDEPGDEEGAVDPTHVPFHAAQPFPF
jgi:hypothetical protein